MIGETFMQISDECSSVLDMRSASAAMLCQGSVVLFYCGCGARFERNLNRALLQVASEST